MIERRHGQRLREIRNHRQMSQRMLARSIGVMVGTIQNYEQGRAHVSVERLEQLALALRCQPADLLEPTGSALPKYRFGAAHHLRSQHQRHDALDHLVAIWDEMRDELRREKGIDIGDQPARDWIEAIRERMGVAETSQQEAKQRRARIRKRLEAYHVMRLK